jgi:hypothetical protein
MTTSTTDTTRQPESAVMPREVKVGWIHFGILAGFLLVMAVGWSLGMRQLGVWTAKRPVAWPVGVAVDKETFQLTSLPERIGPYRVVEETEARDDLLDTLKIATTLDKRRYDSRTSNWYSNRVYEDTREPDNGVYRNWVLDIVFYTGGEVTVPHVPDVCILSGGSRTTGREILTVDLPGGKPPWREDVPIAALFYEPLAVAEDPTLAGTVEFVQYYLFSVNGRPDSSRESVRLALINPFQRYVYYAKVQFLPARPVFDRETANAKAREFMQIMLPEILKQLPSEAYIDRYAREASHEDQATER